MPLSGTFTAPGTGHIPNDTAQSPSHRSPSLYHGVCLSILFHAHIATAVPSNELKPSFGSYLWHTPSTAPPMAWGRSTGARRRGLTASCDARLGANHGAWLADQCGVQSGRCGLVPQLT